MTTNWNPEGVLRDLGLTLPEPPKPVAAYIPARRVGNLLYISGQLPMKDGALMGSGRVPTDVSAERAKACAEQCALNGLAVAKAALGELSKVRGVIRLGVFVASENSFTGQPQVADGASELMQKVFGEAGRHARAAVGTNTLPRGAAVEVEFIFEVE
jgi:enamine deaminase RidA (YjgF/YER057c/UK114 family)